MSNKLDISKSTGQQLARSGIAVPVDVGDHEFSRENHYMHDATGQVYSVSGEHIQELSGMGLRNLRPGRMSKFASMAKTAAGMGEGEAAFLGAASGATLGLSDVIAGTETTEARKTKFPYLSAGMEAVGEAVPAMLSGGAGMASKAARLTPAGAVARLGTKIGAKATAGLLGRGGGLTKATISMGTGQLVEGAFDGAAHMAADAVTRHIQGRDQLELAQLGYGIGLPAIGNAVLGTALRAATATSSAGAKIAAGDVATPKPDAPIDRAAFEAFEEGIVEQQGRIARVHAIGDKLLEDLKYKKMSPESEAAVEAIEDTVVKKFSKNKLKNKVDPYADTITDQGSVMKELDTLTKNESTAVLGKKGHKAKTKARILKAEEYKESLPERPASAEPTKIFKGINKKSLNDMEDVLVVGEAASQSAKADPQSVMDKMSAIVAKAEANGAYIPLKELEKQVGQKLSKRQAMVHRFFGIHSAAEARATDIAIEALQSSRTFNKVSRVIGDNAVAGVGAAIIGRMYGAPMGLLAIGPLRGYRGILPKAVRKVQDKATRWGFHQAARGLDLIYGTTPAARRATSMASAGFVKDQLRTEDDKDRRRQAADIIWSLDMAATKAQDESGQSNLTSFMDSELGGDFGATDIVSDAAIQKLMSVRSSLPRVEPGATREEIAKSLRDSEVGAVFDELTGADDAGIIMDMAAEGRINRRVLESVKKHNRDEYDWYRSMMLMHINEIKKMKPEKRRAIARAFDLPIGLRNSSSLNRTKQVNDMLRQANQPAPASNLKAIKPPRQTISDLPPGER